MISAVPRAVYLTREYVCWPYPFRWPECQLDSDLFRTVLRRIGGLTMQAHKHAFVTVVAVAIVAVFAGIAVGLSAEEVTYADVSYSYNESTHVLTLSATTTGAMPNYVMGEAPWYSKAANTCTSIVWDSDITTVGSWAFYGFTSLAGEFTVPASVTDIGLCAFASTGISSFATSSSSFTCLDGVLMKNNQIVCYPSANSSTSYDVPFSVTSVAPGAFAYSKNLLTLSSSSPSIATIENSPGLYSTDVSEILAFPSGYNESERFVVPSTVTTLTHAVFAGQPHLVGIDLPTSVSEICDYAFAGCTSLVSLSLQPGLNTLGDYILVGAPIRQITLPADVHSLTPLTFHACTSLEEIAVSTENTVYTSEDGVLFQILDDTIEDDPDTEIDERACKYLVRYPISHHGSGYITTKTGCYIIPYGTTYIMAHAFQGCSSLTDIVMTKDVNKIGYMAFAGCSSLFSVRLPHGMSSFEVQGGYSYAFQDCSSLMGVSVGTGLSTIPAGAFDGCNALAAIVVDQDVSKTITCAGAFPTWTGQIRYFDISAASPSYVVQAGTGVSQLVSNRLYTNKEVSEYTSGQFLNKYAKGTPGSTDYPDSVYYYHIFGQSTAQRIGIMTATGEVVGTNPARDLAAQDVNTVLIQYGLKSLQDRALMETKIKILDYPESIIRLNGLIWWHDSDFKALQVNKGVELGTNIVTGTSIAEYVVEEGSQYTNEFNTIADNKHSILNSMLGQAGQLILPDGAISIYLRAEGSAVVVPDSCTYSGNENSRSGYPIRYPDNETTTRAGNYINLLGTNKNLSDPAYTNGFIHIFPQDSTGRFTNNNANNPYWQYSFSSGNWTEIPVGSSAIISADKSLLVREQAMPLTIFSASSGIYWAIYEDTLMIFGSGEIPDYSIPSGSNKAPWYSSGHDHIKYILIQRGITVIGANAFNGFEKLEMLGLPNSITEISEGAFVNCGTSDLGLNGVYIPTSVTRIDPSAFMGNPHLANYVIAAGNNNYISVDGVLFNKAASRIGDTLVKYPQARSGAYSIPDGVTKVGKYAFYGAEITSINLNAVSTIESFSFAKTSLLSLDSNQSTILGAYSFDECKDLSSLTLRSDLGKISEYAFKDAGLSYIVVEERDSPIAGDDLGTGAIPMGKVWYDTTSLNFDVWDGSSLESGKIYSTVNTDTSISIGPELKVQYIPASYSLVMKGSGSMYDYDAAGNPTTTGITAKLPWRNYRASVSSISMPVGITSIGDYAFKDLTSITTVSLPSSLSQVGDYAFSGCTGLNEIGYAGISEPNVLISVGDHAFDNTPSAITVKSSFQQPSKEWSPFATKPSATADVTMIYAAHDTSGTVDLQWYVDDTTLKFQGTYDSIPDYTMSTTPWAKAYGSRITTVEYPNAVISQGAYAFSGCSALESITLPSTFTVKQHSFEGSGLTSIIIQSASTVLETDAFKNVTALKNVTMPVSMILTADVFNGCTSISTVSLTGTACGDYSSSVTANQYQPWMKTTSDLTVILEPGLTSISANMFYQTEHLKKIDLTQVKNDAGISTIGSKAFYQCTGLQELSIGSKSTTIASDAFYDLTGLKTLTMPLDFTDDPIFGGNSCRSLSHLILTGTSCPDYTYESEGSAGTYLNTPWHKVTDTNTNIVVTFDQIDKIGNYMFYDCDRLLIISVPSSVTSIGEYAFYDCDNLAAINLLMSESTYLTNIGTLALETTRYDATPAENFSGTTLCCRFSDLDVSGQNAWIAALYTNGQATESVTTFLYEDGVPYKQCGDSLYVKWLHGTSTIYFLGSGDMWEFTDNGDTGDGKYVRPWQVGFVFDDDSYIVTANDMAKITSVSFCEGITGIAKKAFINLGGLTEATMPSTVRTVGEKAFYGCSLSGYQDMSKVTAVEANAFEGNSGLDWILIPYNADVGTDAFKDCLGVILYATGTQGVSPAPTTVTYADEVKDMKVIMLTDVEADFYQSNGVACVTGTGWSTEGELATTFASGKVYVAADPTSYESDDNVYTASTNSTISFS